MDSGADPTTDILLANLLHLFALDGLGPRAWNAQARATGLTNNGIKKIMELGAAATTTTLDTMGRHLGVPPHLLLDPGLAHLSRLDMHRLRRLGERLQHCDGDTIDLIERLLDLPALRRQLQP